MEGPLKGDVVRVAFPYLDSGEFKNRPALVLARPTRNHVVLCQITSQLLSRVHSIPLLHHDFITGALSKPSRIRPDIIVTMDIRRINGIAGSVSLEKVNEVLKTIFAI